MKAKILIEEQIDDGKQYPDQSKSTIIVKHHTTLKEFFEILKQKILYIILMSAMISVGASLSFIQDWRSKAALGTATLRVLPATGNLSSSKLYQIWLTVDKPVAFAHVEVMFNPDLIKLSQNLTLTNSVLNRVVVQTSIAEANMAGKFVIAIGLDPPQKANAPTGAFKLADFTITPNAALQGQVATIAFGGSSAITAVDAGLMTITPLHTTVTLALDPTPTVVSATNTPTVRPTNAPTITVPTITPTRIPTSVPTVIPSQIPTPTPFIGQDKVEIQSAEIQKSWGMGKLSVVATSDMAPDAKLTVVGYGLLKYSAAKLNYSKSFWLFWDWPTTITVTSSKGGGTTSQVSVTAPR